MRRLGFGLAAAGLAGVIAVGGGMFAHGEAANGASRAPIPITTIADLSGPATGPAFQNSVEGAKVAVKAVNAAGGVNGRPLKLTVCDSKSDPNAAGQCARDAVKNHAAAVLAQFQVAGGVTPVLQRAGIASLGVLPINPEDFRSKIAFPLLPGNVGSRCLTGILANEAHAKRVGIVISAVPGAELGADLLKTYLAARGLKTANVTLVPPGTADLSPSVAAAARGADAIAVLMIPIDILRFVQAARQNGIKLPIAINTLAGSEIRKIGKSADGLYMCSQVRPLSAGGSGVKRFTTEMKKNKATKAATEDYVAVHGWLTVHMFADVAKKVKNVTGASMLKALSTSHNIDGYGLIPSINPTKPFKGLGGNFPRLFNSSVFYARWLSGKETLLRPKAQRLVSGS